MKPLLLIVIVALLGITIGWAAQGDSPTLETPQGSPAEVSAPILSDWREYLAGSRALRIGLASAASRIDLVCDRPFQILAQLGSETVNPSLRLEGEPGELLSFSGEMKDKVVLIPKEGSAWTVNINGRPLPGRYPGKMEVFSPPGGAEPSKAGLVLVNELLLEEYVAGVVASEMPSSFCLEAQRAQAIAARTYALFYLRRHQAEGFDLCAGVHCQAYRGIPDTFSRATAAAFSTRGQILLFQGQPVKALYHSTCGGETASGMYLAEDPAVLPYLAGVPDSPAASRLSGEDEIASFLSRQSDDFCSISPKYRWQVQFSPAEMNAIMQANLGAAVGEPGLKPGRVKSLRVVSRSGVRVYDLEVICDAGTFLVRGNAIRWLFRGNSDKARSGLMSAFFSLSVSKDKAGNPRQYTFTGAGWGHGVGMCQWGAEGRARSGASAAEILSAYYPGTELYSEELAAETGEGNE